MLLRFTPKGIFAAIALLIGLYTGITILNCLVPYDSIDEYAYDYWSTRLSRSPLHPVSALDMVSVNDRTFGYLGFIPDGHFVYSKTLDQIARGEKYSVKPMVNFVPHYVHAAFKLLAGPRVFFFTHTVLLLGAFWALPLIRRRGSLSSGDASAMALLIISTPVLACNMTYAMPEDTGVFGISLFLLSLWQAKKSSSLAATVGMVLGALLAIFYKPIGWCFFPWTLYLMLTYSKGLGKRLGAGAALAILVAGVAFLTWHIYGSAFFSGYKFPLNTLFSENQLGVMNNPSSWRTNLNYGLPALFMAYPLLLVLVWLVLVDLGKSFKAAYQAQFALETGSQLLNRLGFIAPFFFYFGFLLYYNHWTDATDYFTLLNPTFRYFLVPYCILLWYIVFYDLRTPLTRILPAMFALQLAVMFIFPGNIVQRIGFKTYQEVLHRQLVKVMPERSLVMGSYRYIKLLAPENVPTYAFLGHRLSGQFTHMFSDPRYSPVLGTMSDVISAVYQKGYTPICIYPDIRYIDDKIVLDEPPQTLRREEIAAINFTDLLGSFSCMLPVDKRMVKVYKILLDQPQ